jgi:probable F420-dependent oxidoreductase
VLIGAVVPTGELTTPDEIRAYALGVESLGFAHVSIYDHVLGADRSSRPEWRGPYDASDAFHDPFVLFGFMAAMTHRLEFATCVVVLPQRQTAIVAKQAAELAILSGNRFRLGVGIGWNRLEYEGLGMPWARRGARLEEQLMLLRQLWSQRSVEFHGEFDRVDRMGLNPRPHAQIPLWLGGDTMRTFDRIARVGDGWMSRAYRAEDAHSGIKQIRRLAKQHHRDPASLGFEGRVDVTRFGGDIARCVLEARNWQRVGATHVTFATQGGGSPRADDHLAVLRDLSSSLDF